MNKSHYDAREVEIPLKELSPLLIECLTQGQEVLLTITGNSMSPFLRHKRDQVVLTACDDPTALEAGEVPLYRRDNGQYVLHRIVEREEGNTRTRYGCRKALTATGESLTYTLLGDAQWEVEPHIRPDQIVAKATAFIRRGRRWECADSAYRRNRLAWHRLLWARPLLIWLDRRLYWRFCRLFPKYK